MDILRSDRVFFEPPFEVHHYEGLGHLVLSEDAPSGERRLWHLRHAARSFRSFLDEGGEDTEFALAARRRLEDVEERLRRQRVKRKRPRPSPSLPR